jgi:lambda family phage tail tape measure protein
MATATTRNVSIRLAVIEGDKARRELALTGDTGERALKKIKDATAPASRSLVAINAVSQEVRYGMEGLAGSAGSVGNVLGRLGPIGLAAAAVLGGVALATAKGIKEFTEAEQALNGLNASLEATGFASGVTARDITALGEAIEANTLFKKEEIQNAAAALTSFQNIAGDVFTRALELSAKLAVRLGVDVPTAADMLGKSLEYPEKGLSRLARKYTDLSPAQKEVIENFVKQGDVAAAQAVILEHLEGKTRKLAEGQAKGLTGAANKLSDAWDDLMESFGRTVGESTNAQTSLSALTKVVRGLQEALDPTPANRKSLLEKEIADLENSFGTKVDKFVLGSAPNLVAKREELRRINEAIAAEELDADNERRKARASADRIAADRRNQILLGIEREYQKKLKESTQTERDKILEEATAAKKRIEGLFKDSRNSDAARSALESVDASTRAKLAKLDAEAAKPALQLAEANKKVIATLEKRLELEGIADPRARFVQAELDKLSASATREYRDRVTELAGSLYDLEEAEKRAKEAGKSRAKAIEQITQAILETSTGYDVAKEALDQWKEKLIYDLGDASEANQRYLEQIEQIYKVKLKEIYDKSLLDSDKWEDGATRALKRYADEATNAAKNAEELFGSAARKVEDTLVEMVSSGEISFGKIGDLIQSLEQDILRMFIRQQITAPIAGALGDIVKGSGGDIFGSIFGSIFHDGGVVGASSTERRAVPSHVFAGAPRLHSGLMPDEFPAILQRGETVLPKTSKAGGMNITFNIATPNAQSFMDSQGQIMSKFAGQMQRFRVRNN